MLYWALVFFIIAIIAGLFGFTGISIAAAEIAKVLFFIFVVFVSQNLGKSQARIDVSFIMWYNRGKDGRSRAYPPQLNFKV